MKSLMMPDAETVQRAYCRTFRLLSALCFLLVGLAIYTVAQEGKRLILKDGTWQGITKYEVQGDRARYFSSPRAEWEELPKELVDWKATEEWNARPKELSPELRELEAEEEAERKAEEAANPTAAPGLKLPVVGGVFVLDTFSGQRSLDELAQNGSELSNHPGNNILHLPINRKATISQQFELRGPHAHVQAHVLVPEIFVRIETEPHAQQSASADRFRIVRLEPKTDSRVLMRVKVNVLGKQSQSQKIVVTRMESFSGGWLKVVPLAALVPGEYALVEMLGPNKLNSYAWDFGVDPTAPANRNALKAGSPANDKSSDYAPELEPQEK
jgi:hypothetical protein